MGGRGSASMSASDARFFANQRDGFRKIAQHAESGFQSVMKRNIASTARAAEKMVGTDKAVKLVDSPELRLINREIENAHGVIRSQVLGDLETMLSPSTGQRPMNYSEAQWSTAKANVQDAYGQLSAQGYSASEVAAGLAYGRYLRRR